MYAYGYDTPVSACVSEIPTYQIMHIVHAFWFMFMEMELGCFTLMRKQTRMRLSIIKDLLPLFNSVPWKGRSFLVQGSDRNVVFKDGLSLLPFLIHLNYFL